MHLWDMLWAQGILISDGSNVTMKVWPTDIDRVVCQWFGSFALAVLYHSGCTLAEAELLEGFIFSH